MALSLKDKVREKQNELSKDLKEEYKEMQAKLRAKANVEVLKDMGDEGMTVSEFFSATRGKKIKELIGNYTIEFTLTAPDSDTE